jgi:protein-tyrosine phosphatase
VYRPDPRRPAFSWVGEERIAIGGLPTGATIGALPEAGVTHVVNCRATAQTVFSQDLAVERQIFGPCNVVHASMWDHGRPQPAELWAHAAHYAADVLDSDPGARVLIHCQKGRRRSVLVAYAVLRLRGRSPEDAARLILENREDARLVPVYRSCVEEWLRAGAPHRAAAPASC